MNTILLICFGILAVGLIIFLFLVFKKYKKHKAIKHYEELRDKLSIREAEEETGITEEEYSNYHGGFLSNLIRGFIVLMIGFTLLPEISKQVNLARSSTDNLTVGVGLLTILPILFVVAILAIAIGSFFSSFREAGLV